MEFLSCRTMSYLFEGTDYERNRDAGTAIKTEWNPNGQPNWPISRPGEMSPYDLAQPPFNLPKPVECIKTHAVCF